jgi:hypothetical protein
MGQGGAFPSCQDAWNYGWNIANVYASSTYNRLACDAGDREEAEMTLARTFSEYVVAGLDTDAHLVCMYSGLYTGLLERVSIEYKKCYTTAFRCLPWVTVGRYAVAVLAALYDTMANPILLTPEDVMDNFALANVDLAGDQICSACDDDACEVAIGGFLEENGLEVADDLVAQLVESNCVCP